MQDLNVIELSDSPYSSQVVLVKKEDDSYRFCVDFRAINSCSQFNAEPMPNWDDIITKFAFYKVFSRIDLSKGYWEVPLTTSSKPKTAFQTSCELFQSRVIPFGLVTAPAMFSRLMRKLLYGMTNTDNFIDDIIFYNRRRSADSSTSWAPNTIEKRKPDSKTRKMCNRVQEHRMSRPHRRWEQIATTPRQGNGNPRICGT